MPPKGPQTMVETILLWPVNGYVNELEISYRTATSPRTVVPNRATVLSSTAE
jgi:hypothetical protein